jgi:hypothetical protein
MKKLFFTFSLIAISAVGVFAQGISGGLKAGVNFANQIYSGGSLSASADNRTGFHGGAYLNISFSDKFGIQPELLYSSQGSKLADIDYKIDYLTLPVMIKFNPAPIFNIHFGPQFGFLVSAKRDDNDLKDAMKDLDLGAGLGVGVDLPMGLGLSARYVFGLSDTSDDDDNVSIKNTTLQLSLSYKLFGGN